MDNFWQELQFFKKNPRSITNEAKQKLFKLTAELGDISGIVIDINTKQFIGGNQRSDVLDLKTNFDGISWVVEYENPTEQGTLKLGFFTDPRTGEKFNVRLVDWTEEQCDIANLAANYAGGETDFAKLLTNFQPDNLLKVFQNKDWSELKLRANILAQQEKIPLDNISGVIPEASPLTSNNLPELNEKTYSEGNREWRPSDTSNIMTLSLKYTEEDYWYIVNELKNIASSPEDAVKKLLIAND